MMTESRISHSVLAGFLLASLTVVGIGCGQSAPDREVTTATVEGTATLEGADGHSGIRITSGSVSAETDQSGSFTLEGLEPGERVFEASKDGWQTASKTVDVQAPSTSVELTLAPEQNRPPILSTLTADQTRLAPGSQTTVEVSASDPEGEELSYAWSIDGNFNLEEEDQANRQTVVAPDEFNASARLTVTVEDAGGAAESATLRFSTGENRRPNIQSLTTSRTVLETGAMATIDAQVTDPDGDDLSYAWTATGNFQIAKNDDGTSAELTAPSEPGKAGTVTLTVTDGAGAEATASLDFETAENTAPRLVSLTANPPQVQPGGTIDLAVVADDADGDDLSYTWSGPGDWMFEADGDSATLTAPDTFGAEADIGVEITDGNGGTATGQLTVSTVESTGSPIISAFSASPSSLPKGGTAQLSVSATAPDGRPLTYSWQAPANWSLSPNGSTATLTAPNEPGQSATIEVTVEAENGNTASASLLVSTERNTQPIIQNINATPSAVEPSGTMTVQVQATDPDGDPLTYNWSSPNDWSASQNGDTLTLTAPNQYDVTGTVDVTVSDGYGSTASSITVSTTRNLPPNIGSLDASPDPVLPGGTIDLTVSALDPNGDNLSYSWSVAGSGWSIQGSGSSVTLTAPAKLDSQTTVEVTVSDGFGKSTSRALSVSTVSCGADEANCDGDPTNGCEPNDNGTAKKCSSSSCKTILDDGYSTGDGSYWIDPDGSGGVDAFKAYCDMSTDGGGWMKLKVDDVNGDGIFTATYDKSNIDKCGAEITRYYDHVTDSSLKLSDYEYSGNNDHTTESLKYINPATNSNFSSAQVSVIRNQTSDMSTTTKQVTYTCDDDGNTPAHEAYISSGTYRNLTPGTTGNRDAQWYIYHTDSSETFSTSANANASPLSTDEVLPEKLRYGHFAGNSSGGGMTWGYSKDHVLIRLQ